MNTPSCWHRQGLRQSWGKQVIQGKWNLHQQMWGTIATKFYTKTSNPLLAPWISDRLPNNSILRLSTTVFHSGKILQWPSNHALLWPWDLRNLDSVSQLLWRNNKDTSTGGSTPRNTIFPTTSTTVFNTESHSIFSNWSFTSGWMTVREQT